MKQTEIGLIPEDWEVKELGELLLSNPDYGINAAAVKYDDTLPTYLRITDIDDDGRFIKDNLSSVNDTNSSKYYLSNNEIVFARTGASVGKTYLYSKKDGDLVFAGFLIRTKINKDIANSKFVFYNTQTTNYYNWILSNSMRSGQPGINSNEIKTLQIPLPPLPEQEAIANALSDADAWIESLEQLIAKKRLIKQGAMQTLLTPKEDWEVKKLADVGEIVTGNTPSTKDESNYGDEFLFISPADLGERKYIINSDKKLSKKGFALTRKLKSNSIFITCIGSTIGKIGIAKYNCCTNQQINSIICYENINNEFAYYLLGLNADSIKQSASQQAVPLLNKTDFSDLEFSFPKSLTEQTRIATILSDMDTEIEALEAQLDKARQIKQGMMQELLTGRIRLL